MLALLGLLVELSESLYVAVAERARISDQLLAVEGRHLAVVKRFTVLVQLRKHRTQLQVVLA